MLASACPGGARHEKIGSSDEAAFLRGADFLRINAPDDPRPLGEQMLVYCEIASVLPDSFARNIVLAQLRDDRAQILAASPDPSRLSAFHQVVFYCAETHTKGEAPERGDWSPLVARIRRRGLDGAVGIPALEALWPHFTAAEQSQLRSLGRRRLLEEPWFAGRKLPAYDDIRGWYRVTHVLFAVTANGKLPPVGILEEDERIWLRRAIAEAIAGFLEQPSRKDQDDVFAELLVNLRVLSSAGDGVFQRGLDHQLSLQGPDGAFVPTLEPPGTEDLYPRRHLTMVSIWALALRMADDARAGSPSR